MEGDLNKIWKNILCNNDLPFIRMIQGTMQYNGIV